MELWHWFLLYLAAIYPMGAVLLDWAFSDLIDTAKEPADFAALGALWLTSPGIPLILVVFAVGWLAGRLLTRCFKP